MPNENIHLITALIENYFHGLFNGDCEQLQQVFHPQAQLSGEIRGLAYLKSLSEFLDVVKNRKSPVALGESLRMEIISIEVLGEIGIAKLHVPMFEYNYYDYLSLTRLNGKWVIVHKLFTHIA